MRFLPRTAPAILGCGDIVHFERDSGLAALLYACEVAVCIVAPSCSEAVAIDGPARPALRRRRRQQGHMRPVMPSSISVIVTLDDLVVTNPLPRVLRQDATVRVVGVEDLEHVARRVRLFPTTGSHQHATSRWVRGRVTAVDTNEKVRTA